MKARKEGHDWWDTLYENDVAFYKKYKTLEVAWVGAAAARTPPRPRHRAPLSPPPPTSRRRRRRHYPCPSVPHSHERSASFAKNSVLGQPDYYQQAVELNWKKPKEWKTWKKDWVFRRTFQLIRSVSLLMAPIINFFLMIYYPKDICQTVFVISKQGKSIMSLWGTAFCSIILSNLLQTKFFLCSP